MSQWQILHGDVRERLKDLEPQSVQCVVTSPPYFGLRDYGVEGQIGVEGTTGAVAVRLQRNFVGIELNPQYVQLARKRIGSVAPLLAQEIA